MEVCKISQELNSTGNLVLRRISSDFYRDFRVYLLQNPAQAPQALTPVLFPAKTPESLICDVFYTKLQLPLPTQFLLFAWGDWPFEKDAILEISVEFGSSQPFQGVHLGTLSLTQVCCHKLVQFSSEEKKICDSLSECGKMVKLVVRKVEKSKPLLKNLLSTLKIPVKSNHAENSNENQENPPPLKSTANSTIVSAPSNAAIFARTKANMKRKLVELKNSISERKNLDTNPAENSALCRLQKKTPSPRWGHSLTFVEPLGFLLFGGQGAKEKLSEDRVWMFSPPPHLENVEDPSFWAYAPLAGQGSAPSARMGHSAVYVPQEHCVYIHGGSKIKQWFHNLYKLDLATMLWAEVLEKKPSPQQKSANKAVAYHSCVLHGGHLYYFGGVLINDCNNSLRIFDLKARLWSQPHLSGSIPAPRSGHTATLVSHPETHSAQLLIFGGWNEPVCFNDLHVLDLSSLQFTRAHTTGTPPPPRTWHVACCFENRFFFVFGGFDGEKSLSDLYVLDLIRLVWLPLDLSPTSRLVDTSAAPHGWNWNFLARKRAGSACILIPKVSSREGLHSEGMIGLYGGGDNEGWWGSDLIFIPLCRIKQIVGETFS